jgi:hypothetical protein
VFSFHCSGIIFKLIHINMIYVTFLLLECVRFHCV